MILSELISSDRAECAGRIDIDISSITNDSREVEEGGLYFAIPGAKVDGAKFIPGAINDGAAAIVTEWDSAKLKSEFGLTDDELGKVTIVKVENARYMMGVMSSRFYGEPSKRLKVIGITGTKGKTTTAYMIHDMLERAGHKTGLVGTIEINDGKNIIPAKNTTPESIKLHKVFKDMIENGLDSVVMEVSSQGLKLNRVAGVDFDYGIFTNLSPDHIGPDEHDSYEEYRDCKKLLFSIVKKGFFNIDDPESAYMMDGSTCEMITFGEKEDADYRASDIKIRKEMGTLGIEYTLSGKMNADIMVDLPGDFSVHNSLAAIVVADEMGVSKDKICEILKKVKVRGRVEMIPISDKFTLMIDYAHNDMSLKSLIQAIRQYEPKRIVTLFGCGGNRSKERRYGMGEVSGKYADFTVITSDNPRNEDPQAIIDDIKVGIGRTDGKYVEIIDRKEAIRYAIMNAVEGDIVILAGKGHEDYQEICGIKHHMDERDLIREILEEEDVTKICGYNNRYFA
ncbi:MAG: UDP-N-acetylmuramoyl-L-alanyl-D-glutamate--2,6-diaminopimelate ligase [Eubacterium sp.]|nr:UDP-N-acetylmuramoyl-L-alanyl-D-glutamate--2,6-diaminopimelate ligase [Eubacterium sp.]